MYTFVSTHKQVCFHVSSALQPPEGFPAFFVVFIFCLPFFSVIRQKTISCMAHRQRHFHYDIVSRLIMRHAGVMAVGAANAHNPSKIPLICFLHWVPWGRAHTLSFLCTDLLLCIQIIPNIIREFQADYLVVFIVCFVVIMSPPLHHCDPCCYKQ